MIISKEILEVITEIVELSTKYNKPIEEILEKFEEAINFFQKKFIYKEMTLIQTHPENTTITKETKETCKICGKSFNRLKTHVKRIHGITYEEYLKMNKEEKKSEEIETIKEKESKAENINKENQEHKIIEKEEKETEKNADLNSEELKEEEDNEILLGAEEKVKELDELLENGDEVIIEDFILNEENSETEIEL